MLQVGTFCLTYTEFFETDGHCCFLWPDIHMLPSPVSAFLHDSVEERDKVGTLYSQRSSIVEFYTHMYMIFHNTPRVLLIYPCALVCFHLLLLFSGKHFHVDSTWQS